MCLLLLDRYLLAFVHIYSIMIMHNDTILFAHAVCVQYSVISHWQVPLTQCSVSLHWTDPWHWSVTFLSEKKTKIILKYCFQQNSFLNCCIFIFLLFLYAICLFRVTHIIDRFSSSVLHFWGMCIIYIPCQKWCNTIYFFRIVFLLNS